MSPLGRLVPFFEVPEKRVWVPNPRFCCVGSTGLTIDFGLPRAFFLEKGLGAAAGSLPLGFVRLFWDWTAKIPLAVEESIASFE